MHDIKWIRENPEAFDASLEKRGAQPQSAELLKLDEERRTLMTELQTLQSKRNDISKQVGIAKSKKEDASHLFEEMKTIGPAVKKLEEQVAELDEKQTEILVTLPNILDASVPAGKDEDDNVEVLKWGEPKDIANPQAHYDLGEALGMMDFEMGAKLAGSRFVWLQGGLARLERALTAFMLDTHTQRHNYTEVSPPFMVNEKALFGTGQLPKFDEDLFKTDMNYMLIPTSEVPLTNSVQGEILSAETLPIKLTAATPCFRSEAGSAGRDTRGMIRVHQFTKVEMVQIVHPEKSFEALEEMRGHAEHILQQLGLPYRVVNLCSGDIGFGAHKTYDLEVWLPAQGKYREISSVSNCGAFQARRMKARFRSGEKQTEFVHTLNGSGLAVGRTLVAVLENYQLADGSIAIPEVLQPYMGGQKVISKPQEHSKAG
ncbi:MAG: serine--tRNA ligase [Magnetococcales bacterium]|nr:serine--tRNA ligase [Magnetococcales bacterium]|tara:strand:- start:371934 stop:373223 length:1290 start_codon:yes stop_codon:yes gene_type:complete